MKKLSTIPFHTEGKALFRKEFHNPYHPLRCVDILQEGFKPDKFYLMVFRQSSAVASRWVKIRYENGRIYDAFYSYENNTGRGSSDTVIQGVWGVINTFLRGRYDSLDEMDSAGVLGL